MVRSEYLRFMQTLGSGEVVPGVRKLANLVLENLDELAYLGTHQGQRVKRLVALAQANWDVLSIEIESFPELAEEETPSITKLKNMIVGPFRGFSRQEFFDLESHLVLIYGQNGAGKSSFCEALEYSLLGTVVEAESKRFRDQSDYLKNAYVNHFETPIVTGLNEQGDEVEVEANETLFRFCFVEKNRIDSFSRIAAQAPAKQTELISTLFGLDSFNEFVRNFTSELDARYIDLSGEKASQLLQKQQMVFGSNHQLESNKGMLQELSREEQVLASEYRDGASYDQLVFELNGDDENVGEIKRLEIELQQPLERKTNITVSGLRLLNDSLNHNLDKLKSTQQSLVVASQDLSFKDLYDAVVKLESSSPEHCPACKTPLSQVFVNPYINANEELKDLKYLAELQETVHWLEQHINSRLQEVSQILSVCLTHLLQDNPLQGFQTSLDLQPNLEWWYALQERLEDGLSPWQHLENQVKHLEESDEKIDQNAQINSSHQARLNVLRRFKERTTILETRRGEAEKGIKSAEEEITSFSEENAQLIAEVTAEADIVKSNKEIAASYKIFVDMLNAYKNSLPGRLVADLGDLVVHLYNAFNRYDSEVDKLASAQLPLYQNQRLEIAFLKDPCTFFDALHVLSEGHVRCLGLAILLAKNIKERCPVLIFDDPVNAIDDEHRRAIRETLFVDDFFDGHQVILAVHGEEFFKDIHQLIGKKQADASRSYIFRPIDGEDHIQVESLSRPKNYVLAARELHAQGEYRDALMSARRALENLCERTWYHYGKYCSKDDALISVSRRSPSVPWDLKALAQNLKAKLVRSKSNIPNKDLIVSALDDVLGEDGRSVHWTNLNKGTHDETDLPGFDRHTVNETVLALERLDDALVNMKD